LFPCAPITKRQNAAVAWRALPASPNKTALSPITAEANAVIPTRMERVGTPRLMSADSTKPEMKFPGMWRELARAR
jgi:hypothetical protein